MSEVLPSFSVPRVNRGVLAAPSEALLRGCFRPHHVGNVPLTTVVPAFVRVSGPTVGVAQMGRSAESAPKQSGNVHGSCAPLGGSNEGPLFASGRHPPPVPRADESPLMSCSLVVSEPARVVQALPVGSQLMPRGFSGLKDVYGPQHGSSIGIAGVGIGVRPSLASSPRVLCSRAERRGPPDFPAEHAEDRARLRGSDRAPGPSAGPPENRQRSREPPRCPT